MITGPFEPPKPKEIFPSTLRALQAMKAVPASGTYCAPAMSKMVCARSSGRTVSVEPVSKIAAWAWKEEGVMTVVPELVVMLREVKETAIASTLPLIWDG